MTESANCGRQIHIAALALRAVRNTGLEKNGIVFDLWVVMEAMAETPGMNRETLLRRLAELTVHNEASAAQAIDELHERGLITTSTDDLGTTEQTTQSKALSEKVIATRSDLRNQLYGGIPAEDFATTKRVLDLIRERASTVHAGQ